MTNALLWRYDRRRPTWNRTLTLASLALGAGFAVRANCPRMLAGAAPNELALWIWVSLLFVLACTMLHSWQRVSRERDAGTLELLTSTPRGMRGLLRTELLLEQRWFFQQIWLIALWGAWSVGEPFSTMFFRLCCLTTFPLVAVCGALAGTRLALTGRAASSFAIAVLAPLSIVVLPLAMIAVQDLPFFEMWSWLMALKAHMVTVFMQATVAAGLWQSCEQALRDGGALPGAAIPRLPALRLLHLGRDPFVQRERWRLAQRSARLWSVMGTALGAMFAPWILTSLCGWPLPLAVAASALVAVAGCWLMAWAAGADAVQAEVDRRSIDGLLTLPVQRHATLRGLTLGSLVPLGLGALFTMPWWGSLYAITVGPVALAGFVVLAAAGAFLAARLAVTARWRRLEG